MKNRIWLISFVLGSLVFYLLITTVINIVLDPYQEYGWVRKPWNISKFQEDRRTGAIRLIERLNEGHYSLVFGTSRSAYISRETTGKNILNFSNSVSGNPKDVYAVLTQLSDEQLAHIDKIYYLLDRYAFENREDIYSDIQLNAPYSKELESFRNVTRKKWYDSIQMLVRNVSGKHFNTVTEFGDSNLIDKTWTIRSEQELFFPERLKIFNDPESLNALGKLDHFCREKNIEIIYFTGVSHVLYIYNTDFKLLELQFANILDQIDHFYSLLYIEEVSDKTSNFRDWAHHSKELTRYEVSILDDLAKRQRFKITKQNYRQYLSQLKKNIYAYDVYQFIEGGRP